MKKLALTLAAVFSAIALVAKVPHQEFKGVPINGTLKTFSAQMEKNGFELKATGKGRVQMEGDFAGYKNCVLDISTLYQKDLVSFVTLSFPYRTSWSDLESDYFNLKDMLALKYGNPRSSREEFTARVPKTDSDRLYELGLDRCVYSSSFQAAYGEIRLSIKHNSTRTFHVELVYSDRANTEIIKSVAIGDL